MKMNKIGFTLVEMMAVVVLVALVASFALVGFGGTKEKTEEQNEAVEAVATGGMTAIQIAKKEYNSGLQQPPSDPCRHEMGSQARCSICLNENNRQYQACCPCE